MSRANFNRYKFNYKKMATPNVGMRCTPCAATGIGQYGEQCRTCQGRGFRYIMPSKKETRS
jgi:hypothetical protein